MKRAAPLVAFLLFASPLRAADDAAQREAEARFQEGLALHDAGSYEQARLKFAQAYSVWPSPNVLFNLARTEQLTGREVDAIVHYRKFLRESADPRVKAQDIERAQAHVEALSKRVGHLKVDAPVDAILKVDGQRIESSEVDVSPGRHALVMVHRGLVQERVFDVNAGRIASISLLPEKKSDDSARVIVPIILLGSAVVAAGAGVGFLMASSSDRDHADDLRRRLPDPSGSCADGSASICQDIRDSVDAYALEHHLSTGLFIGAGALAVAGTATWLLWPKASSDSKRGVRVGPLGLGTGVSVGGAF